VDTHNLLHALGQAFADQVLLQPNVGSVTPHRLENECLWAGESIERVGLGELRQEGKDR
jgi:hypothetical protein